MAESFLRRWFGGLRKEPPTVAEARAELDRLAEERPAFRAPILWLRELLPDLMPASAAPSVPALSPEQACARLAAGVPLLRGERLAVDAGRFRRRWSRACDALETLQPDGAATALARAMKAGQLDPAALVEAVTSGNASYIRQRAAELSLHPDLAATLTRYTLFPEFAALEAALAPLRARAAWARGECPTCGSRPLLGEFRGLDQSRYLRCGLCAASWEVDRQWCPLCDNRDYLTLHFLHVEGEEARCRAALCDVCRGYVKMLSTLSALPPLTLVVADASTLHLDLAAVERGYAL
jgi:FdhE protein